MTSVTKPSGSVGDEATDTAEHDADGGRQKVQRHARDRAPHAGRAGARALQQHRGRGDDGSLHDSALACEQAAAGVQYAQVSCSQGRIRSMQAMSMRKTEYTMLVHYMHVQAHVLRVKMMAACKTRRRCIHASVKRVS